MRVISESSPTAVFAFLLLFVGSSLAQNSGCPPRLGISVFGQSEFSSTDNSCGSLDFGGAETTTTTTTTSTTAAPTTTTTTSTTAAPTTTTTTSTTAATTTTTTTTTTTSTTTTTTLAPGGTLTFAQGWNLVGNGTDAPIDVTTAFADTSQFVTIWKWVASQGAWRFYAPALAAQGDTVLADYAASKGYQVLNSVAGGEGFWVNAKLPASVSVTQGQNISVASVGATLLKGWNLVSVGESATPKQFCDAQSTGVTTLWAWDNPQSKWYFYAPNLEGQGGTALNDYIIGKGYLDFTENSKTLGNGVGFWVNKP